MIVVNERWVILVDEYNYIVAPNKPMKDSKTGADKYKAKAYCRSLSDALERVLEEEVRISLADGEKSLGEAVSTVRTVCEKMRSTFDRILEDDLK